jgi:cyanate permease
MLAIVLALTVASIVVPVVINRDWQVLASVMAVVYLIALSLLLASYRSSFDITVEKMDEWATSAQQTFSGQFNPYA